MENGPFIDSLPIYSMVYLRNRWTLLGPQNLGRWTNAQGILDPKLGGCPPSGIDEKRNEHWGKWWFNHGLTMQNGGLTMKNDGLTMKKCGLAMKMVV